MTEFCKGVFNTFPNVRTLSTEKKGGLGCNQGKGVNWLDMYFRRLIHLYLIIFPTVQVLLPMKMVIPSDRTKKRCLNFLPLLPSYKYEYNIVFYRYIKL